MAGMSNKKGKEDRAGVPIPPPLLFMACLGAGVVMELFFPSRPVNWTWPPRIIAAGFLFVICGLTTIGAFSALHRHKTPFDPAKATVRIVKEGSFRFSRHPLYLSLVLLLGGIAVLICSIWLFAVVPVLFILLELFAVRPEEEYLTGKFGKEYEDYRASVRRWF
jgi:protein-S-isoprenylcysteine O-methyltransferase Ste14